MTQPVQVVTTSQPIPSISGTFQVPLTQPLQGTLQSQSLGQIIPKLHVEQSAYVMEQPPLNPPYVGMMQTPTGE